MDFMREMVEKSYLYFKPQIFSRTEKDPQEAHESMIRISNFLNKTGLDKFLLNHSDNYNNKNSNLKISNAAGFNKNADLHPLFLKYLGFDRVVIGTVTNDSWKGNPRPTIKRYTQTESMVNWMGLPGEGSQVIAQRLCNYLDHEVPLTINLMSTPGKKGDDLIKDLEETILDTKDIPYVDRYELNISCPNIKNEYQKQLDDMLHTVVNSLYPSQELYLKVSPDLNIKEADEILSISDKYSISGFTTTNTTTNHDPKYISNSPEKGGASGKAVYENSLNVQKMFNENNNLKIIACGGIDSPEKAFERLKYGANEIQIYTPLIFQGPKIIRELRNAY